MTRVWTELLETCRMAAMLRECPECQKMKFPFFTSDVPFHFGQQHKFICPNCHQEYQLVVVPKRLPLRFRNFWKAVMEKDG